MSKVEELQYRSLVYQLALWEDPDIDSETREALLTIFKRDFPIKTDRWASDSGDIRDLAKYITGEK